MSTWRPSSAQPAQASTAPAAKKKKKTKRTASASSVSTAPGRPRNDYTPKQHVFPDVGKFSLEKLAGDPEYMDVGDLEEEFRPYRDAYSTHKAYFKDTISHVRLESDTTVYQVMQMIESGVPREDEKYRLTPANPDDPQTTRTVQLDYIKLVKLEGAFVRLYPSNELNLVLTQAEPEVARNLAFAKLTFANDVDEGDHSISVLPELTFGLVLGDKAGKKRTMLAPCDIGPVALNLVMTFPSQTLNFVKSSTPGHNAQTHADLAKYGDRRSKHVHEYTLVFRHEVPAGDNEIEVCEYMKPYINCFIEANKLMRSSKIEQKPLIDAVCEPALHNELGTWELQPEYQSIEAYKQLNNVRLFGASFGFRLSWTLVSRPNASASTIFLDAWSSSTVLQGPASQH
jgi:hypothetical protein